MTDAPDGTHATVRWATMRDGRTLCYAEYGDPAGSPVVLLHGTPASRLLGGLFDEDAQQLGVRVIAPDRPGFGGSPPQPARTFLDHARDVVDLLDELTIDRAAVAGISGGGTYALACGLAAPDRLTRVLLVSGATPMLRWSDTRGAFLGNRLIYYVGGRWPQLLERAVRSATRRRHDHTRDRTHLGRRGLFSLPPADRAVLARPEVAALMAEQSAEALRNGSDGLLQDVLLYSNPAPFPLADVRVPVRLLHGTADRNVPVALAHRVEAALPDCWARYYSGEGHLFVFDRTAEILEVALHDEVPTTRVGRPARPSHEQEVLGTGAGRRPSSDTTTGSLP